MQVESAPAGAGGSWWLCGANSSRFLGMLCFGFSNVAPGFLSERASAGILLRSAWRPNLESSRTKVTLSPFCLRAAFVILAYPSILRGVRQVLGLLPVRGRLR